MKTKMIPLMILSAVLLLSVPSCKKTQVQSEEPSAATTPAAGKTPGDIHNEILNSIAAQPGFPSVSQQDAFMVAANYMKQFNGTVSGEELSASFSARMKNTTSHTTSDMFGSYNGRIFSALYSSVSVADFYAKTAGIESEINADASLSKAQQTAYYGSLSILKSSLAYWHDALTNVKHPWHATLMKYVSQPKSQGREQLVAGSCLSQFNPFDMMPFTICVAVVDALSYDDAYWYIYNGSNHSYASQQANAQASYASGVAAGLGMIVNEQ